MLHFIAVDADRVDAIIAAAKADDYAVLREAIRGGTVSLVRKRPLATPWFEMSTTLGSWSNYRIELEPRAR